MATPVRQPRGPSSNSFGAASPARTFGPPTPDTESLRRANTVSNPRHHASASISSSSAGSTAFHGRFGASVRNRSDSLSGHSDTPGELSRNSSVREVRAVLESTEEVMEDVEPSHWGKGLSRQSSLPSRRGWSRRIAELKTVQKPKSDFEAMPPPSRPIRRPSPAPSSSHAPSLSLSSLMAFRDEDGNTSSLSRAHSLRNRIKTTDATGGLNRSSSLKEPQVRSGARPLLIPAPFP